MNLSPHGRQSRLRRVTFRSLAAASFATLEAPREEPLTSYLAILHEIVAKLFGNSVSISQEGLKVYQLFSAAYEEIQDVWACQAFLRPVGSVFEANQCWWPNSGVCP